MASVTSHGVKATTSASTTHDGTPSSPDSVAGASVLLTLLIAATISGNLLVCVAFHLCRPLRTVTNYFVVSLSVADLLVGFVCMPFWFVFLIRGWPEQTSPVYALWICLDIVSGTASIMNLAVISVDRYCAITYPFEYHALLTKFRARLCIVFVWLYALTVALLRLVPRHDGTNWYTYFVAIASFFIPLPAMIFSYIRILSVALKHARHKIRLGSFPESVNDFSEASPTTDFRESGRSLAPSGGARRCPPSSKTRFSQISVRQMRRRFSTELKAAKTLAIVMGTFILCWAPYIFTMLINVSCPKCFPIDIGIAKAIKWLHYSNSAMNPIIYTALNRNFREAFRRILCRCESGGGGGCTRSFSNLVSRNTSRNIHSSGVRISIKPEAQASALVYVERVTVL